MEIVGLADSQQIRKSHRISQCRTRYHRAQTSGTRSARILQESANRADRHNSGPGKTGRIPRRGHRRPPGKDSRICAHYRAGTLHKTGIPGIYHAGIYRGHLQLRHSPRHRQGGRAGRHPAQTRQADPGGIRGHQDPHHPGRRCPAGRGSKNRRPDPS